MFVKSCELPRLHLYVQMKCTRQAKTISDTVSRIRMFGRGIVLKNRPVHGLSWGSAPWSLRPDSPHWCCLEQQASLSISASALSPGTWHTGGRWSSRASLTGGFSTCLLITNATLASLPVTSFWALPRASSHKSSPSWEI